VVRCSRRADDAPVSAKSAKGPHPPRAADRRRHPSMNTSAMQREAASRAMKAARSVGMERSMAQAMGAAGVGAVASGGDGRFFSSTKKGETQEIRVELQSQSKDKKINAVKKVIANMTVGKDVSALFPDVLNCIQTGNIELKKLVYLYLVNHAKSHPELALMAVNTFVRDAADPNPLVRALAIRTMGCIRVERITEYLCEPLERALKDEDPYVRKTAAVCVAKLHDISPDMVKDRGFLDLLRDLVADANPTVVANAVVALSEIAEDYDADDDVMGMSSAKLQKLLAALNECTEWGQVSILDALAKYVPEEARDAERIIERVMPRLQHANSAVVLSAIKVILQYMHEALDPESELCATYRKKLSPPLVTMVNTAEPELCYVALRNVNLIVQRDQRILENEIKIFFCRYNDPPYVKQEKLEIMIRLVSDRTVDQVLLELKEYSQEVDIDFVRTAIKAVGRVAVKLEHAAQRCVNVLLELIKARVPYVVQAAVVVVANIFRRYPNRYESIIGALCENLESLDEPEAKEAMIWIVGEYADAIENADELLQGFLEDFQESEHAVRLQLLTACVKLFLKSPERGDAQQMVQSVLSMATECTDDPDLRDRGYIYWRLLSNDPEAAKAIVLGPKPPVADDTLKIDEATLDLLLSQIGQLSSVFHQPADTFVNASVAKEEDPEEAYDDFDDDDEPPVAAPASKGGDLLDLLDMGPVAAAVPVVSGGDALVADALGDIFGGDTNASTSALGDIFGGPGPDMLAQDPFGTTAQDPFGGTMMTTPPPAPAPARKPVQVLQPSQQTGGVGVKAAFNAGADRTISLDLEISNAGSQPVRLLQIQLNKSPFGLACADAPSLTFDPPLLPGTSRPQRLRLRAGDAKMLAPVPAMGAGVNVQIAVKNADSGAVFYLAAPCPLDAVFAADATVDRSAFIARWKAIDDANESYATVADLPTGPSIDAAVAKLAARRCHPVARRAVPGQAGSEVAYFSVKLAGPQEEFLVELTFKAGVAACKVCVKTTAQPLAPLGLAAICALLRAP